jgi:prepilin-type N-terminal cleavage/methylation domain-containing protein
MTGRMKAAGTAHREAQRGLTLIELLVTIILSGLFFAAMVPVFVMASQQGQTDRARVLATNTAQSTIEMLRDLPYDDLYDTDWSQYSAVEALIDPQWKGTGSGLDIGVVPYPIGSPKEQERYLLVSVRAWWTRSGGSTRNVTLETAVYRQGLGTQTLLLYAYPLSGDRITTLEPVNVVARVDAGDAYLTKRVDFEVWANNGTAIASWSVFTRQDDPDRGTSAYARQDGTDGYWYFEQTWAAEGVPDGPYTFIAKSIPLDPEDPDYDGDWTRKEYILDRSRPEKPTVEYCRPGFQLQTPTGPLIPTATLSWSLDEGISDVVGLQIYRTGVDAGGVPLADKSITISSKSATAYVDRDVVVGNTYTYKVMVKDAVDQEGQWSDEVSCTIPEPGTEVAPAAPPMPLGATVDGRSVTLTWSPSPDREDVYAYRVYRDTALSVPIVSLETGGSTSTDPYSYTDPTVAYGGTYTYFVTAVSYYDVNPADDDPGVFWESYSLSAAPVQIPQPQSLSMRISLAVATLPQGATKPTYARVAIHSLDTGAIVPANLWEYPTLKFVGSSKEWDTDAKQPAPVTLYEGSYEVIAMFYSQTGVRLGTYTTHVELTSLDFPVVVTYLGTN